MALGIASVFHIRAHRGYAGAACDPAATPPILRGSTFVRQGLDGIAKAMKQPT